MKKNNIEGENLMFDFKYIYDGSDEASGYYDEKKEKADRYTQAGIWIGMVIVFGTLLLFCISKNVGEIIMIHNANSVIGSYTPDATSVSFVDGEGNTHVVNISDVIVAHSGNQITLYYYNNDYANARYVTALGFWVFMYIFFGGIFLVSLRFCLKNIKLTHHYKGVQRKYTN